MAAAKAPAVAPPTVGGISYNFGLALRCVAVQT